MEDPKIPNAKSALSVGQQSSSICSKEYYKFFDDLIVSMRETRNKLNEIDREMAKIQKRLEAGGL